MTIPIIDGETERLPEAEVPPEGTVYFVMGWHLGVGSWAIACGPRKSREEAMDTASSLSPNWSHPTIVRVVLGGER